LPSPDGALRFTTRLYRLPVLLDTTRAVYRGAYGLQHRGWFHHWPDARSRITFTLPDITSNATSRGSLRTAHRLVPALPARVVVSRYRLPRSVRSRRRTIRLARDRSRTLHFSPTPPPRYTCIRSGWTRRAFALRSHSEPLPMNTLSTPAAAGWLAFLCGARGHFYGYPAAQHSHSRGSAIRASTLSTPTFPRCHLSTAYRFCLPLHTCAFTRTFYCCSYGWRILSVGLYGWFVPHASAPFTTITQRSSTFHRFSFTYRYYPARSPRRPTQFFHHFLHLACRTTTGSFAAYRF